MTKKKTAPKPTKTNDPKAAGELVKVDKPTRKRGRPKKTDEDRTAEELEKKAAADKAKAEEVAEENRKAFNRVFCKKLIGGGYQVIDSAFSSGLDEIITELKEEHPKDEAVIALPDSCAMTAEEAAQGADATEAVLDKYFPGMLDNLGPEIMLMGFIAGNVVAKFQLVDELKKINKRYTFENKDNEPKESK